MLDLLISESPTEGKVKESLEGFVQRIQRALFRWGVKTLSFDPELLGKAHIHALTLLRTYQEPSCFKSAAAMTMGLVSCKPFNVVLPKQFGSIKDKPNALFAILESVYWMDGAELRMKGGEIRTLKNSIEFSDHFLRNSLPWPIRLDGRRRSLQLNFQRTTTVNFEFWP